MTIGWKKITSAISKVEEYIILCSMIVALVLVFSNVVLRYLFSRNITWASERATYLLVFAVYASISVTIRNGNIVKITVFEVFFPKSSKYLRYFEALVGLSVGGLFIFLGLKVIAFLIQISFKTPAMNIPYAIPYSIIVFGGALIILRSIQRINSSSTTSKE